MKKRTNNLKSSMALSGFNFKSKVMAALLMICILTVSAPAAPEVIKNQTLNVVQEVRFQMLTSWLAIEYPNILGFLVSNNKKRSSSPTIPIRVEIYPQEETITLAKGSKYNFAAVGFDAENEALSGMGATWSVRRDTENATERFLQNGTFPANRVGTFKLKATINGISDETTVVVVNPEQENENKNRGQNAKPTPIKVSSRTGRENKGGPRNNQVANLLPGDGWTDDNWESADVPGNLPGNPTGAPLDGGAGNGNFQITAPVVSLPGRGIDLALNLVYNSRVWNKSGTEMTYDIGYDEPAPGWSLGFGKIEHMGEGGCMLVDADGTRHGYTGSMTSSSSYMNFKGHTTDGKFIDYACQFSYGIGGDGWAALPNGTVVRYSSISSTEAHLQPTSITDINGNFITITYRNVLGNALIETVTDTMGRVTFFDYDANDRLIQVRVPGMNDGVSARYRTAIKLHYKQLTLAHSFASGTTARVRNSTPYVIDAIYYPGTNTGYWFGDSDSYSSYGMITKVIEQRGMSWSGSVGTQGTVTQGTMTKRADYNYPLTTTNASGRTNGVGLSDAPTYTNLEESWAASDVVSSAVTTYALNDNTWHDDGTGSKPARSVIVTQPNGTKSKQYTHRTPGTWTDGLVFSDETTVMNGVTETTVSKSNVSWQQGAYDSPRPAWAQMFDEDGKKVKTIYDYTGGLFNQITKSCDYDDANNKLKCATAEYENNSAYVGNFTGSGEFNGGQHLFNLVKKAVVEDSVGTIVSRTDYEYDNYSSNALTDTAGVIQHDQKYNPFTTATQDGNCILWDPAISIPTCSIQGEEVWVPTTGGYSAFCDCQDYDQVTVYDPVTDKRGNITKTTVYTNASAASGAIEERKQYDITGNIIKINSSCCEQISISYDDPNTTEIDTQYAYPISQTHGSSNGASPLKVTSSSVYDFSTGLVFSSTDTNGRTSTVEYNSDTLRPVKSTSSTGAYTTTSYDDTNMTVTEEVRDSGGNLAGKSIKYLNGIGLVKKEESFAPSSIVDIVETKYDEYGREWKTSRPYRSGDTVQWSEKFYDSQDRLIKVVEPDGSETKAFYNENTLPDAVSAKPGNRIRVMDAWGRERWGRYDQQGRLIEVVEPNPDASTNSTGSIFTAGSLLTKYKYDTMGRLVETEQGSQTRKFKYDDLGRLTRQKLAEQTATLNDAGTFVGAGDSNAKWSSAFVYDNRSNLTGRTDARGVKANYRYQDGLGNPDPLNRIQQVDYDLTGSMVSGLTVHAAANVFYEYMTSGDRRRIKKIETQGILTEEFAYDVESRVIENKQTVNYRSSYPMTVNYLYDSLDRVTEVTYPKHYGLSGNPRRVVSHEFDTASRLSSLKLDSTEIAGNIVYNASDQTTQMKVGPTGTNQVTENYTFDAQTGLLTNQTAVMNSATLLDLSYNYARNNSVGSLNGKTGHLTKIINNLDTNKNREYEFDVLGRLTKAKGGTTGTLWSQTYTFDRYGNRTNVAASGTAADSSPIPIDGIPNLTYDNSSNRITTSGYEYDVAGNQIRSLAEDGVTWVKYEYDAANRLRTVKKDDVNQTEVQTFQYGSSNARLMALDHSTNQWTIYAAEGGSVMAEYTEFTANTPTWTKSYTYLGDSQLSTITPNGTGGEHTEYNHPDRLGTRTITAQNGGVSYEQAHLPFGTALNAESTTANNKRFTSYDRSPKTGLDYAVNRTYDNKLGRFSQVDPIGMGAASLAAPQTLNMYSYCGNDPINNTDPSGLFFGKLFKWLKKIIKWVILIVAVVAMVLSVAGMILGPAAMLAFSHTLIGGILNFIAQIPGMIGSSLFGSFTGSIAGSLGITTEAMLGVMTSVINSAFGMVVLIASKASVGTLSNYFANSNKETKQQRRRRLIKSAIASALWRLQNKPDCKAYIKGNSSHDPEETLKALSNGDKITYDSTLGNKANSPIAQVQGKNVGKGTKSAISLGDKWFDDPTVGGWVGSMNRPRTMTNILLHELKHSVDKGHTGEPNNEYYNEISKRCFDVIP